MKAKDIIQYEDDNKNTILLIVNKTVCRAFEVSAFWLSRCMVAKKFYSKYSRSLNSHMIYTWFSVRKLDKTLDALHTQGFQPISYKDCYIILKKEGVKPDGYDEWRENMYDNAMVEHQNYVVENVE